MASTMPQTSELIVAKAAKGGARAKTGLRVERYFTRAGVNPYDEIEWEQRTASITNEKGKVVFEQANVEIPRAWSQMATNVVVSKYFRGPLGSPQREHSVRQMIGRVVDTITRWGLKDGYFATEEDAQAFADELTHILVHQKACFNSPVWFNCGIEEKPQCSACFILSVDDTMDSILDWYRKEGVIFKGGSGSGVNLSKIRSSKEQLAGGGTASGPVSFMKAADASAGVIKSGGKTRRAAKMVVLNIDHPDIEEFIKCKVEEEKKAWALIEAGYDSSLDGPAYGSVFFQNANNSVRVSDEFMQAVQEDREWKTRYVRSGDVCDTYKARDLLKMIAESTYFCGDPGMQYDTTINDWHTCSGTGRINASNPCSEYMHLDNSACNLASLNLMMFVGEGGEFDCNG
ncbi:MAG TPA: vitamin B12-dependent ribonucleotide reductase, partial [Methylomirabilota bacterium]|nr:vitamin B12-dependent ribonucleotide reductase [Methylomirabilota bacterium]